MDNQYGKNYENAKKWVANLKNSFQPLTMSGNKVFQQAHCMKLLRALALKELEDIAQQDREEKLRNREQNFSLEKRKSSQRQDLRDPIEEEEELEVVRIKQIKKNEIISSISTENTNNIIEDEDNTFNGKQFLVQHNTIGKTFFTDCFKSSLLSLMYNNFSQPSEDLAKLFHALETIEDVFDHLQKIHKNQAVTLSGGSKHIFDECFGYVVENILLTKEEFINEIIKKSERLQLFIEKTKVHSEHLYILLSRVIQHEYRQNVQLFSEKNFSPLLQIFTNICSKATKEDLRVAFPHYIKINSNSLLQKAVQYEKPIQGENYLKEAFKEKLYLLKNQGLDANESDNIASFLVYMVFRLKELFEDLFEIFQQYNQCVQQQIMERLSKDSQKSKFKNYLEEQTRTDSQPPFLQTVLSVFEYNNSYFLQVFLFDVLTQFIDTDQKQRILDLILGHISQTPHILDFLSRFPQYFQESFIVDYKNIKDLQAPTCAAFKDKFAFLPEDKISSIHLLLLRRFLLEDSWFITKENVAEFIAYFLQKIDIDVLLTFLQTFVTEECLNLNNIVGLLLLKIASIAFNNENEKQINAVQQIIQELAQNRIWQINQSFATALVIFFQDICSKEERDTLISKLMTYFGTIPQGTEVKEAFSSLFQSQNTSELVEGMTN